MLLRHFSLLPKLLSQTNNSLDTAFNPDVNIATLSEQGEASYLC